MAKRIKIGEPVNDSEAWGFEQLERELPSDYLLITNVELPTSTGQLLEIDAIVFGAAAIYLVDIKGYSGTVEADANVWLHNERRIDNPLSKANQVARIYASRIRESLRHGEHAPWCQGMVFITGQNGSGLSLRKSQDNLSVFGPQEIVSGLTEEKFVTSLHKHPISESQRENAINVLGRLGRQPTGPAQIAGFNKVRKLGEVEGVVQWLATTNRGELRSDWILKEVDVTSGDEPSQAAADNLKAEYIRYQQLSGVPGIAACAPLISDGERIVLPISLPVGKRLSEWDIGEIDREVALNAFRTFVSAAEQFQARDLGYVSPSLDRIFMDDQGGITLLASGDQAAAGCSPIEAVGAIWKKLEQAIQSKSIGQWIADETETEFADLRFLIASEVSGKHSATAEPASVEQGAVLLGRYRLESQLESVGGVDTWRARHEAGRFPLVCTVVGSAETRWRHAQRRLALLMQNFHPGVERIFDIEHLPDDDIYVVNRSWVEAGSVSEIVDPAAAVSLLISALEALSYLHSMGILHRRICPAHVLAQADRAVLVSLSALPREELVDSIPEYVHPSVVEEGWSERADLWALCKTFTDTCIEHLKAVQPEAAERLSAFVKNIDSVALDANYAEVFGLQQRQLITELPAGIAEKWGISKGYMAFITLDMLNDGQPRSRNQIVLQALRSRRIAGNKTNKSSMSATVSRLKAAGVVEDHGKKVRLTAGFLEDWRAAGVA